MEGSVLDPDSPTGLKALFEAFCILDPQRLAAQVWGVRALQQTHRPPYRKSCRSLLFPPPALQTNMMDATGTKLRSGSTLLVSLGPEGLVRMQGMNPGCGFFEFLLRVVEFRNCLRASLVDIVRRLFREFSSFSFSRDDPGQGQGQGVLSSRRCSR